MKSLWPRSSPWSPRLHSLTDQSIDESSYRKPPFPLWCGGASPARLGRSVRRGTARPLNARRSNHYVRCLRPLLTLASIVTPVPAAWSNYSHHHRPASAVRLVVVHISEGSYSGAVGWFRNPHARAAANYVVGRDGRIAHMVP